MRLEKFRDAICFSDYDAKLIVDVNGVEYPITAISDTGKTVRLFTDPDKVGAFNPEDYYNGFESNVSTAVDDGLLSTEDFELFVEDLPCYFGCIRGAQNATSADIPVLLELAFLDIALDESIIMVSVTDQEKPNYLYWLDAAEGYPGAQVTEIVRKNDNGYYTVYNILFPATPKL
jgi:hypothetical protein